MVAVLKRWILALSIAGVAMGLLLAQAAKAQEAAGTWHGTLALRTGPIRIAVKLKPVAGGLQGSIFSPEQLAEDRPLDDVKQAGGHLSFGYKPAGGRFDGEWDAAKGAWVGDWTNAAGDIPLVLERGDIPKGPVVAGLDGDWEGSIALPQTSLRLVLHVKTGPYERWPCSTRRTSSPWACRSPA